MMDSKNRLQNMSKEEAKIIAHVLYKMQKEKNLGEGIYLVRQICDCLSARKFTMAIDTVKSNSDELWSYPAIRRFIHDVIYAIGYVDPVSGKMVND